MFARSPLASSVLISASSSSSFASIWATASFAGQSKPTRAARF